MQLNLLKSKIHRAEVTDLSLHYEGSLAIDAEFMAMVGIMEFEKILVGNMANARTDAAEAEQWIPKVLLLGESNARIIKRPAA